MNVSGTKDLEAFDLLDHPIWVWGPSAREIWWANKSALQFWTPPGTDVSVIENIIIDDEEIDRLRGYLSQLKNQEFNIQDSWVARANGFSRKISGKISLIELQDVGDMLLIEVQDATAQDFSAQSLDLAAALEKVAACENELQSYARLTSE